MNEYIRYNVEEIGTRCAYDSETAVIINDDHSLLESLGYDKTPTIVNISPNQKLTFFGLSVKVPDNASKMVKWNSSEINSVLLLFLDADGNPVENSFAYQLTMDNVLELEIDDTESS